jgi:NitT/TauT family transport system permease protein
MSSVLNASLRSDGGPDGAAAAPRGRRLASRTRGGTALDRGWVRWLLRGGSVLAALAAWQLLAGEKVVAWLRFDEFPTPVQVARRFGQEAATAQYYQDLAQSLLRILTGFSIAAVAGIGLGLLVSRSRLAENLLQPLFEITRPIPAIALVPVAILLFPANEQGIVFITAVAAFFPVLVSTRHAVRALPVVWEDAVATMGAGRLRILRSVVLPGILPGVFGGLSVGMGVAWICVISAEMISGSFGVGYRTWQAYTIVDYPGVLVGMITIGVLGWLTSGAVELAGRRVTRWLPRQDRGAA